MADRISLQALVTQLVEGFVSAAEAVEKKHPDWLVDSTELLVRGAVKVEKRPGGDVIVIDLDEPERVMSEFRIPLRRQFTKPEPR